MSSYSPALSLKLWVDCEALDLMGSKTCCNHFTLRAVSLKPGVCSLLISYPVSPKRFQYRIQRRVPIHIGATAARRGFC